MTVKLVGALCIGLVAVTALSIVILAIVSEERLTPPSSSLGSDEDGFASGKFGGGLEVTLRRF